MTLRELERNSIVQFVTQAAADGYLSGRVLDYGCGKQPYREIVEAAGGNYVPYDDPTFPGFAGDKCEWPNWDPDPDWDAVLCNQVAQYVEDIHDFIRVLHWFIKDKSGFLVMTYPTNWPEVETEDIHRFTKSGMTLLLENAGFRIIRHEQRASALMVVSHYESENERIALGYGVICRA